MPLEFHNSNIKLSRLRILVGVYSQENLLKWNNILQKYVWVLIHSRKEPMYGMIFLFKLLVCKLWNKYCFETKSLDQVDNVPINVLCQLDLRPLLAFIPLQEVHEMEMTDCFHVKIVQKIMIGVGKFWFVHVYMSNLRCQNVSE